MDRDVRNHEAPNEESRLRPEAQRAHERVDMGQTVADGLGDEENVRDVAEPVPDEETVRQGELYADQREDLQTPDLDAMTASVSELLSEKRQGEGFDVFAWSDGSVTNSETPPNEAAYLVSLFSPDDHPGDANIRQLLKKGLRTSPDESEPI